MCSAHTWTPDCLHTQNTQMGRPSPHSTSVTLKTNLVGTREWSFPSRNFIIQRHSDVALQWLRCCALHCMNSHRCYQGEPLLPLSKQHNSSSLPAHLPRTHLQSTQGDDPFLFFYTTLNLSLLTSNYHTLKFSRCCRKDRTRITNDKWSLPIATSIRITG